MQKAIIVRDDSTGESLKSLNQFLNEEWKVVQVCDMASSSGSQTIHSYINPTCLVIIEKVTK